MAVSLNVGIDRVVIGILAEESVEPFGVVCVADELDLHVAGLRDHLEGVFEITEALLVFVVDASSETSLLLFELGLDLS